MRRHSVIWWVLLFCGIVCSGMLLYQRAAAEWEDRAACAAIAQKDVTWLAQESGLSEDIWKQTLQEAGVRWYIGDGAQGFVFPGAAAVHGYQLPAALVETKDRTGMHIPDDFSVEDCPGPMVKALYLYDGYAKRATEGDAQKIQDLMFRAVLERGARLVILTPFRTAEGDAILDPAVYATCLDGLKERLAERGISFGETSSCMETSPLQPLLTWAAALAPLMLGVALVCRFGRLRKREPLLSIGAAILLAVLFLAAPALAQRAAMLGAALVFPCWLACFVGALPQWEPRWMRSCPDFGAMLLLLICVVGWGLLGGASVAALMSSRMYLMGVSIFAGVKVALLVPMVFACGILFSVLRGALWEVGLKKWLLFALAVSIVCGVCGAFLIRSGDRTSIPAFEEALRNWLETVLYVRPRTKELFFAAPCIPLFLWGCRRRLALVQLICGLGVCFECISVTNTFCHAVAPLYVSAIRTLLGAGLGFVLGLIVVGLLEVSFRWLARVRPGMEQAT